MIRRPPRSTRTDTLFPYATLFRSRQILTQFSDLGLAAPILGALAAKGYSSPTPIQSGGIPPILEGRDLLGIAATGRSEEHTSELQSLMRISYAVFCLKKKTKINHQITRQQKEQKQKT